MVFLDASSGNLDQLMVEVRKNLRGTKHSIREFLVCAMTVIRLTVLLTARLTPRLAGRGRGVCAGSFR